jgi:hypothetical protein
MAELATWTPPKIRTLIEAQRDYAATVLTVDAVADFWKLEDFARRKHGPLPVSPRSPCSSIPNSIPNPPIPWWATRATNC